MNHCGCPDGRLFLLHSLVVIHFRQLCSLFSMYHSLSFLSSTFIS
ncbi:hypothetical protein SELSPUOL_01316 [Selenomonas sputigena ATCC 35185]|uniref:Uncharacterized protein n=1 Tax=Selenomonas sputigena (strain ATCC 35185 / DSM 20758 / CCUG 44933 / VPI D19B-28) TaxID=546271 RepID=C9LV26_SELS3|nr:hypothetical protein SELSPUOL_01316 [Selenomonas sputigena ATCC 35185]